MMPAFIEMICHVPPQYQCVTLECSFNKCIAEMNDSFTKATEFVSAIVLKVLFQCVEDFC